MASYMEMSLEDIIKRKKRENVRNKGPPPPRVKGPPSKRANGPPPKRANGPPPKRANGPPPKRGYRPIRDLPLPRNRPVMDARIKIMSKKRTHITDAREKLAQLTKPIDARLRLEQLRRKRMALGQIQGYTKAFFAHNRPKFIRNPHILNDDVVFVDRTRQVVSQPLSRSLAARRHANNNKPFLEHRSIGPSSSGASSRVRPIRRTVDNDVVVIDDDSMDEDDFVPKPSALNRKANLQLRIIAHNTDVRENRSSTYRPPSPERQKSPPRPPSILKKRPMAALRSEKKSEKNEKPSLEHRIIVSNLRNTVTGADIEELFGDVGGMVESRLVRPGTAEVIYKTLEDAQKAVDLYHNRQLDGQPMNCLLVAPRSSSTISSRSGSKPALVSSNSNVEPDISTFHKVLFSNF